MCSHTTAAVHLVFVLGTRPEAIKLAPIILAARARGSEFRSTIINTGQHEQLSLDALAVFGLKADVDLQIMNPCQTPADVLARILERLPRALAREQPGVVLVQGDTSTALGAALSAYHLKVPIAHVEAGLRTGDRYIPFPEEMNRRLISPLACYHFAPTKSARDHLLHEGITESSILITGNSIIDALYYLRDKAAPPRELAQGLSGRMLLVTSHRRENHGAGIRSICTALQDIIVQCPDIHVVFPVHPNPDVNRDVFGLLGDLPQIRLIPPVDYPQLVWLLERATLVLTDSGGVQEEAPAFGKPVLVLRDVTERPEGIEAGVARLVGTARQNIVESALHLLQNPSAYAAMAKTVSPYGDGHASERILRFLHERISGVAATTIDPLDMASS